MCIIFACMQQTDTKSVNNGNSVLFVICMASSLVPFMGSSLNLALPYINESLSLDVVTSSWIPTSYMLFTAIFQVPCARIADMVGRKKMYIGGVVLFTLFSFLSCLADTGFALIVYRCLSGIGSAMMFGTSMALLTSAVPPERRGRAFGINTAVVYSSLAAGPLLGGVLTQYFNWHSIFFVSGIIGTIVVIGSLLVLKEEWKEEKKTTFDLVGSILYAIGLFALIYGFSDLPKVTSFMLVAAGSLLLLFFSFYEKRQSYPVFNIREFLSNRVFKLSSLSALINYSSTSAIAFMLSLYLQYIRGLSPRDAGFILVSQSVVQTIATLISGRLSDKISATFLATLGMGIISVGLIGLCFLTETSNLFMLIALLALLGLGFGIFSSPNANIIMSSVEQKHYGMASATIGTMRQTGQALSMGIAIMSMSVIIGNVQISPEVYAQLLSSMRLVFIICSVLCLIGVYFSSIRERK